MNNLRLDEKMNDGKKSGKKEDRKNKNIQEKKGKKY
jgi:hypothetical protein